MTEIYEVPANIDELFKEVNANGGSQSYRIINYAEDMAMDNNESMAHFVESAGIPEECIEDDEGTQIIVTHPDYPFKIQIDAGGLGDFFSHGFECTTLPVESLASNRQQDKKTDKKGENNMSSILRAGDCILAMDENKELIVEGIWTQGSSHCIDFSAKYQDVFGILYDGSPIYCNRGFSFKDEGVIWKRKDETEVEKELKMQIRLLFDDILDEQPSPAILEKVAVYCRVNDEYANGNIMESDVRENILCVLREGLRALEGK